MTSNQVSAEISWFQLFLIFPYPRNVVGCRTLELCIFVTREKKYCWADLAVGEFFRFGKEWILAKSKKIQSLSEMDLGQTISVVWCYNGLPLHTNSQWCLNGKSQWFIRDNEKIGKWYTSWATSLCDSIQLCLFIVALAYECQWQWMEPFHYNAFSL